MKTFVFLLVASILTIAGIESAEANSCGISDSTCEFYNCMEKEMNCGPDGYLQNYGHPYCQKFVNDELKFSPTSQVWLQDVRYCLQEQLAAKEGQITCDAMYAEAMHSHVDCYVATGFCELSFSEQYKVFWHLKGALADLRTWQEGYLLNRACANKNPVTYTPEFFQAIEQIH